MLFSEKADFMKITKLKIPKQTERMTLRHIKRVPIDISRYEQGTPKRELGSFDERDYSARAVCKFTKLDLDSKGTLFLFLDVYLIIDRRNDKFTSLSPQNVKLPVNIIQYLKSSQFMIKISAKKSILRTKKYLSLMNL